MVGDAVLRVGMVVQEGTLLAQQSELERLCGALEQTLARIKRTGWYQTEQQGVKMATKASMKLKVPSTPLADSD
eukprot:1614021-Rhodomonas_salina.6